MRLDLPQMEPIVDFLQRHLKAAGPRRFAAIARLTGVSPWLLPKLAYGMRDNPRVQTVQPLLDYFHEVEAGVQTLPEQEAGPDGDAVSESHAPRAGAAAGHDAAAE